MNMLKMTVGQMAKLNNITPETLRHYDREGLLVPCEVDDDSGYRYYHINQSARLDMIQYLQSHGIPLKQIREFLESADSESLRKILQTHLHSLDIDISRMHQNRESIVRMLDNHERYRNLPDNCTLFYEHIEKRTIFVHRTERNYFDQDDIGYELMLRELKQALLENDFPVSYFVHAGTLLRSAHLSMGELYSDEVFCFVEPGFRNAEQVEDLSAGLYLCVCNDNYLQEPDQVRQLVKKIDEDGYIIAGDYVCEVVEEFPGLDVSPRKLIYKAQIPVKKQF